MRWLVITFKSWLGSLIGLLVIATLIYFLGPALVIRGARPFESEVYRYILIALLFVVWALWQSWCFWQAHQKNRQLIQQLVQPAPPQLSANEQATKEEIEQLTEHLQDALKSLEKTRINTKDALHLYELPWYIIIGPPGSGKTTLLANSNLHFPLSDKYGKDAVRGVGGTRNCDWWFTDDAILLDTAGRYTTQDSQKVVDQAAWLGFLKLLAQYRGRQPINGVLVAVSLGDLLQQTTEIQAEHTKAIRQRIQELYEQLGVRFPVYMLFTKVDLIAGFSEFFDDLDKLGREQVWGFTFPYQPEESANPVITFDQEFNLLEERLNQQLLEKLDKERSVDRRRTLYLFPQQFTALKSNLQQFVEQIFQASRYEQTVLLRGIYFTSATQEGMPIDRIMLSLANSFGISPQKVSRFSAQGKSFFINHLLNQVIFKEAGLVGRNLQLEHKLKWLQSSALVSALVLALIAIIFWSVSYWYNRQIQVDFYTRVTQLQQKFASIPMDNMPNVLAALDGVQALSWKYATLQPNLPWITRLGLNQTVGMRRAMDDQYESLLKEALSPQIKALLEQQIKSSLNQPNKANALFSTLKNYLFLGGVAPQGSQPVVMQVDWNNNGHLDAADNSLTVHTKNLLNLGGGAAILNESLLKDARNSLREIKIDQLAYLAFQQKSINESVAYNFIITDKKNLGNIQNSFQKLSKKSWANNVPGFFTKAGYEKVFLPNYQKAAATFAQESWVLGQNVGRLQDSQQLAMEYQRYYQEAYVGAWNEFINDFAPAPINDLASAKSVLLGLTSNADNMLFRLMEEVTAETNFAGTKDNALISFSSKPVLPALDLVDTQFKRIHEWATDQQRFQRINQLLDTIYAQLDQPDAFNQVENNALTKALAELESEALKLRTTFGQLLGEFSKNVKQHVVGQIQQEARQQLAADVKAKLGDFCTTYLVRRYPLMSTTSEGVDLGSFNDFFGRNGLVDQFRMQTLANVRIDAASIQQLKQQLDPVDKIRKAFFPKGDLEFSYELKLISLGPQFQSVQLSTGTQNQVFKNGETKTFRWPDGKDVTLQGETKADALNGVDPNAEPASSNPTAKTPQLTILFQDVGDDWIILRLLEKKNWKISGVVEFQVVPSLNNPFQVATKELRSFKCPKL